MIVNAAGESTEIFRLRRRIRILVGGFIVGLVLSGVTAFPLLVELRLMCSWLGLPPDAQAAHYTGVAHWLVFVREGLEVTYARYPFIGYGTDWLAFGHIIIALFFIAPCREPGRHLEVLRVGLVACVLVIPLALICGPVRGIPFFWQLIDCSFGVFGLVPLWLSLKWAKRLNAMGGA